MLPFCLTDLKLRVVTQLGATIGKQVPIWDQRDEFGSTNHLVTRQEEAGSLARWLPRRARDGLDEAPRRNGRCVQPSRARFPIDLWLPRRRAAVASPSIRTHRRLHRRRNRTGWQLPRSNAVAGLGLLVRSAPCMTNAKNAFRVE